MPRQSNGTYVQPSNTAAVSGTTISSAAYNSLITDLGSEVTNSLDRLGRAGMQANLSMANYNINNLATPTASTDAANKAYVDAVIASGAIMPYAMATAPAGWLSCGGQAVSRATYASLFAAIGVTYGAGDGATTFNLPNFNGKAAFLRGYDGGTTAAALGTMQANQNASHTHTITDPGHIHGVTDPSHNHGINNPAHSHGVSDPGHSHSINTTGPNGNGGGGLVGFGSSSTANTNSSGTGISINAATTAISANAAATGISVNTASTGITAVASGGNETRPTNFSVFYCIKT